MERSDLEQWGPKDVARLLSLVGGQHRYFQELVAALPIGVLVLSADRQILLANKAVRAIFSLPSQGPLKLDLRSVLPSWVLSRVEQVVKTAVPQTDLSFEAAPARRLRIGIVPIQGWQEESGREALLTVEELGVTSSPVSASLRGTRVPVRGEVSAPAVTELVEDVSAVIWVVDARNMHPIFVSPEAVRLLGFPPEFWVSNPSFWTDRVHPADRERVLEFYQRAVKRGRDSTCEFRSVRADGQVIWLRETVRVIADSTGRAAYLAGVTLDVTQRRMIAQQSIQQERIDAIQGLASRMAHDLNNVLMILQGNAEEVLNGLPAGSALRAEVEAIIGAAQRITDLTGHLLAFTRRAPVVLEALELEPVLSASAQRLGLQRKGALSQSRVNANTAQLEQVLTAISSGMRKPGQSAPLVTIEASVVEIREDLRQDNGPLRPGNYIAITISASGSAAQGEIGPGVFERVFPEKGENAEAGPSLAQAYAIVQQWGGDISVTSSADEGTVFRIFLPSVGILPGAEIAAAESAELRAQRKVPTILIVEDEAGIRALVQRFLRKQGYETLEAMDGEEALEIVQGHREPIDLLITDMIMPQMGGRELVDRLRAQGRDLKILYISGYTDDSTVYAAELPVGSAFLQKPFTLSSLLEKVRGLLGSQPLGS